MNIWLISAFEPTPYDKSFSSRFVCIAEECRKRGHCVTFFSTTFKHPTKEQRFDKTTTIEIDEDYDLIFVKSKAYKNNLSLKRMRSHSELSKELVVEMNNRKEIPDAIFMAYPPISTADNVSEWARKRGVPFIVDLIDPWPDSFRKMMPWMPEKGQNLLLKPFIKKTKRIFDRADAITGIAKERLTWAKSYNPTCYEYHYYYPSADLTEVQQKMSEIANTTDKSEKLQIIYAGSLASSYNIPTILKAADFLSKYYTNKIEFVIAGAGPQEDIIKDYIESHKNLRYVGRLSKEDLMKEYYKSDLGLIQHLPGAFQTVTYKLFDLLSCGLPILNSLESELNDIVIDNEVGLFNKPHDFEKLTENILYCFNHPEKLHQMKKRAIQVTAKLGDTSKVYSDVVKLMEGLNSSNEKVRKSYQPTIE